MATLIYCSWFSASPDLSVPAKGFETYVCGEIDSVSHASLVLSPAKSVREFRVLGLCGLQASAFSIQS